MHVLYTQEAVHMNRNFTQFPVCGTENAVYSKKCLHCGREQDAYPNIASLDSRPSRPTSVYGQQYPFDISQVSMSRQSSRSAQILLARATPGISQFSIMPSQDAQAMQQIFAEKPSSLVTSSENTEPPQSQPENTTSTAPSNITPPPPTSRGYHQSEPRESRRARRLREQDRYRYPDVSEFEPSPIPEMRRPPSRPGDPGDRRRRRENLQRSYEGHVAREMRGGATREEAVATARAARDDTSENESIYAQEEATYRARHGGKRGTSGSGTRSRYGEKMKKKTVWFADWRVESP